MSSTTIKKLILVGGTGGLGTEIAKGLVTAAGYTAKKALVRDASSDKAKALTNMGWETVEVKDYSDAAALESAMQGAETVVSTISGGDMVTIETAVLTAAKKVGATLFVPSQFGVDYRRWGTSFPFLAGKKAVLDAAQAAGMPTLSLFVGLFSDWIFGFFADLEAAKITWVGDGTTKVSWTRRSDIGYVLAKALETDLRTKGGTLSIQGDYMSFKDAGELLGQTLGKEFTVEYMDPQEALKNEQELLEKGMKGDVGSFYGSFKLHLLGEPARGNDGCDLSAEANDFGHKMQTLKEVFQSGVYGTPK